MREPAMTMIRKSVPIIVMGVLGLAAGAGFSITPFYFIIPSILVIAALLFLFYHLLSAFSRARIYWITIICLALLYIGVSNVICYLHRFIQPSSYESVPMNKVIADLNARGQAAGIFIVPDKDVLSQVVTIGWKSPIQIYDAVDLLVSNRYASSAQILRVPTGYMVGGARITRILLKKTPKDTHEK